MPFFIMFFRLHIRRESAALIIIPGAHCSHRRLQRISHDPNPRSIPGGVGHDGASAGSFVLLMRAGGADMVEDQSGLAAVAAAFPVNRRLPYQ